jgi:hypothetical protein
MTAGRNDPREKAYVAIVATPDGGSAFQDRSLCLEDRVVAQALPPLGVAQLSGVGGVLLLRSDAFDSPPHPAPRRQWVIPLRGELLVTVSDGTSRRFGPGDLVLVTDTTGAGHATVATVGEALFVPVE